MPVYYVCLEENGRWRVKRFCGENLLEARQLLLDLALKGLKCAILTRVRNEPLVVYKTAGPMDDGDTLSLTSITVTPKR